MKQHFAAISCGIFGATASCLAKLSFSNTNESPILSMVYQKCETEIIGDDTNVEQVLFQKINYVLGELMIKYGIKLRNQYNYILYDFIGDKLHLFEVDWCQVVVTFGPRLIGLILVLICNVLMASYFVRGLQQSGSIIGTSLSTASNFALSALYGYAIYQESFTLDWWIGFSLIVIGVLLLISVAAPSTLNPPHRHKVRQSRVVKASSTSASKRNVTTVQFGKRAGKNKEIVERGCYTELCPLCDVQLFDNEGNSSLAIADLSPHCYYLMHAKCLKQQKTPTAGSSSSSSSSFFGNRSFSASGFPLGNKGISMWVSSRQAAHFAAFWLERVEKALQKVGPNSNPSTKRQEPVPAKVIRDMLRKDESLSDEQLKYIDDDPTGLGKGLQSALEWGGSIDYNDVTVGQMGWKNYLKSRGIWDYYAKTDDLWLWEWNPVHPRKRCDGCQFILGSRGDKKFTLECAGCVGSLECAYYCSESCQKRDWQRHKLTCEAWQNA